MKTLHPREAYQLLTQNPAAKLIDCRSRMEYVFVGHPVGAVHIPWNDGPDWEINPHFTLQVQKIASATDPILVLCRSGHRSAEAASILIDAGFADVYNIAEGFEGPLDGNRHRNTLGGWRFAGLPWEQG